MVDDNGQSPKYREFRQYISDFIQGPNSDALINTFADEITKQEELSVAIGKQLTICTASEVYLDKRLADVGITRPPELGMDDQAFRDMGIQINSAKQISQIIQSVLTTFYGEDATYAWTQSVQASPYVLAIGMDLTMSFEDGTAYTFVISDTDFTNPTSVTSQELADTITRFLRSSGLTSFARSFYDYETGNSYVRIYGGANGPYSAVKVLGGEIQSVLEFPNVRGTELALNNTVWEITKIRGNTIRFRWTGGSKPSLDKVIVGDVALIYGGQFKTEGFGGSFTVTDVRPPKTAPAYDSGWFDVFNPEEMSLRSSLPNVAPPANIPPDIWYFKTLTQALYGDLKFFKVTVNSPYLKNRYSLAFEPARTLLKIYMPATTRIISRELIGAAHLHNLYPEGELDGSFGSAYNIEDKLIILNEFSVKFRSTGYDCVAYGGTLTHGSNNFDIDYVTRSVGWTTVCCAEPHDITNVYDIAQLVQVGTNITVTTALPNSAVVGDLVEIQGIPITTWVGIDTYGLDEIVQYNGITYRSIQATNTGNQPDVSPLWWFAEIHNFNQQFVIESVIDSLNFTINAINPAIFTISSIGTSTFTSQDGVARSIDTISIVTDRQDVDDFANDFIGPYMVDPTVNYTLTDRLAYSRQRVLAGQQIKTLFVSGYLPNVRGALLFDLGRDTEEGPVRYFGSQSASAPTSVSIQTISQNGTTVTVICTSPHGLIPGTSVSIAGTVNFNGVKTVELTPNEVTFKFSKTPPAIISESVGTVSTLSADASSTIIIDPSYTFRYNHEIGGDVNLLSDTKAYEPNPTGTDYAPYITGTAEARVYAEQLMADLVAFGVNLQITIIYPNDVGLGNAGGSDSFDSPPTSDKIVVWGPDSI